MRSENAISETANKYGRYCHYIAFNILHNDEDSEECTNDTYLKAWETIPPNRPDKLSAFLGKITRNLALDKYRLYNTQKRGAGQISFVLDELQECIPTANNTEQIVDDLMLTQVLNQFLASLSATKRKIFMRRYWYLSTVKEISVVISSYISDGLSDISKKDWEQTMFEFKRLTGITYDDFKKMIPSNWEIESFRSMSAKVYEDNKYMIHDFILTYLTENNSTARISFCPFEAPLRDLFVMCDNPKQSEINGVPVTIYGYDNCYIAQFSYNNLNYDIETKDATEEELETLLAAIISK